MSRARRSQAVEQVKASPARAKLFANGRSQAVRLPKDFRMPGDEVVIRREGDTIVLEPIAPGGWPADYWQRIDAIGAGVADQWRRPADPVPPPIRRERTLP